MLSNSRVDLDIVEMEYEKKDVKKKKRNEVNGILCHSSRILTGMNRSSEMIMLQAVSSSQFPCVSSDTRSTCFVTPSLCLSVIN